MAKKQEGEGDTMIDGKPVVYRSVDIRVKQQKEDQASSITNRLLSLVKK